MGKNFSRNNASGKRREADFYRTHPSLVWQLLDAMSFEGAIFDPCCGAGDIVQACRDIGFEAWGHDLNTDGEDFLKSTSLCDTIITNPPYSLALEFILHAKKVCRDRFCFLLPLTYLQGKERFDLVWMDEAFPLAWVLPFTRYPMLGAAPRDDGKYPTGMQAYAWFLWQKDWDNSPRIRWLDNDKYVLRKIDKHI